MFTHLILSIAATANHWSICDVDNEFCQANAVSEPIRSCTEGFVYSEEEACCVATLTYEPLFACPGGEIPSPTGLCVCSVQQRFTCEDPRYHFDRSTNLCHYSELTPMIPSCAHRPELMGEISDDGHFCKYYVEAFSKPKCQLPFKLRDGVCVQAVPIPEALVYTCPDGWTLDGKECSIVEQVACEDPYVMKHKKKCLSKKYKDCDSDSFEPLAAEAVFDIDTRRLCHNCKVHVKPEHVCQLAECKAALTECICDGHTCSGPCSAPQSHHWEKELMAKERSVVTPVVCERFTTAPAKANCLSGGYDHHKEACCQTVTQEPEIWCSHSTEGPFACNKTRKYLPNHVCPAPFEVRCGHKAPKASKLAHPSTCECVLPHETPSVTYCPDGTVRSGDLCTKTVPAELYCPEKGASFVNGMCTRIEREPARAEYTVTYITEEPCEIDECIEKKITVKKRKIAHKAVHKRKGKTHTQCFDSKCIDIDGAEVHEVFGDGIESEYSV